ncbi:MULTISPECIES: GNAT family N-acetyltransferase [Caloramator]|uniref:Acetyltransferase, GNAT family n=1 Tax=Caloramator australicus RC3 TaxID=857293 RepID=G0V489_9CLOT|nr:MULTISPECIES: GNAT family N-acetyltransferase [Caloramator]MDO6354936.1 GNAT family N-acetyltransferase [Caloramator sp. CAR-1]CCC57929.1 acetyltransferase, GNAT family [Caloramator australicus RC3]
MNFLALKIAWDVHKKQLRKGSSIPYIIHPIEVAIILYENGADEELLNAAILHDTLEDTTGNREELLNKLKNNFSRRTIDLILAASEPLKVKTKEKLTQEEEIKTWRERKEHTIEFVKGASRDIKMLICADKLSNIRSTYRDYKRLGKKVWEKFNAGYEDQKWYYESLVKALEELKGLKMYDEFKNLVEQIFNYDKKDIIIKYADIEEKKVLMEGIKREWGSDIILSKGKVHRIIELPWLIAVSEGEILGFLIYSIEKAECEIVLLESLVKNIGVGSKLLKELTSIAKKECQRIFLITTNDNIDAMKFYQKNGFEMVAIYKDAVKRARCIKPQIPLIGNYEIPIKDEIEFELRFS